MLLSLVFAVQSSAQVFTVYLPRPAQSAAVTNILAAHGDVWHWRRGTNEPQADWSATADSGLDDSWSTAPGGFGFGDNAISGEATHVEPGMANVHTTLFIRRTFQVPDSLGSNAAFVLSVDFDDGFVAYIDGVEIARRNVPGAAGSPVSHTNTTGGVSHEASCCQSPNPPFTTQLGTLSPGPHVLALIGLNQSIGSSDFHLIPDLVSIQTPHATNSEPVMNQGLYALTTTNQLILRGSNSIPGGVRVTVNGDDASLDPDSGTWSSPVELSPGWNSIYLAVHDSQGGILTNFEQQIVYEAAALRVGGTLIGNMLWNDPATVVYVTSNIVVPADASLTIGPGTVVLLPDGVSITATGGGRIEVQGADAQRVMFLPATTKAWNWLMASGTNAILSVRHAELVAGQVRVDNAGELLIEDSIIRDLPDTGREVVKAVAGRALTMRRTYLARFTEGDSRDTPVLVEGCLLEGFLVDGMDIKATNAPLVIQRTTFRNADPGNSNADAIDFGPGAGTVESCLIHDFPDKGVSIGGAPGTSINNTLIYRCGIGISAYASSDLVIQNSTVASCLNGILFRDNPTRAVGAGTNLIVWHNTTNVAVLNSSTLSLAYSDVQGTNYPGSGNTSVDPLFSVPTQDDFRLTSSSPCLTAASDNEPMGVRFPIGGIPSAPQRLIVLSRDNGTVQLSWIDSAENEDGFLIERSLDRAAWQFHASVPANATSFAFTSPAGQQSAYFRVRATNDVGFSQWSNPSRQTTALPLSLAISRPQPGQVVLQFTATAEKTYVLQARTSWSTLSWTNWMTIPATAPGVVNLTNDVPNTGGFFRLLSK